MSSRFPGRLLAGLAALVLAGLAHAQSATVIARDDFYDFYENAPARDIDVLRNDLPWDSAASLTFSIVAAPVHGTLQPSAVVGQVNYVPPADFSGSDGFAYRICNAGGECDEAFVAISVHPLGLPQFSADKPSGNTIARIANLRALASLRFDSTPLVAGVDRVLKVATDPTPHLPWDSAVGSDYKLTTLPPTADGRDLVHRIAVPQYLGRRQVEVSIGIDDNRDGRPSPGEARCARTSLTACDMEVVQRGDRSVAWWIRAHNVGEEITMTLQTFDVPMVPGDGSLVVTGPGHVERLESFVMRFAWDDETMIDRWRMGYVTLRDGDDVVGLIPVDFHPTFSAGFYRDALPLVPGRDRRLAVEGKSEHRGVYVDVPAGATRLRVSTSGPYTVGLSLVFVAESTPTDSNTVAHAPQILPYAYGSGSLGNQSVVVEGAALEARGRWHAVVRNDQGTTVPVTIRAEIEGNGLPPMRGGYFNPKRSGSGIFLYPAGDQLAGLWYTYDGAQPTWYYLQAPTAQAPGQWSSDIYRSAWDGDGNTLTAIGHVTMTTRDDGRLRLSYRLDGKTGSEVMESFGSGCPAGVGGVVDASSHWFDPARAGSGYSVQLFPDYEFFAAFVYDEQGVGRFVAAELGRAGGSEADLVLQQLRGSCPTCSYIPTTRYDVGTLRRRLGAGGIESIETQMAFVEPLAGSWNVLDQVQLLGGPGTTQGCD